IALDLARSCLPPLLAARQPCLPRRHAARSTARYHGQHASGFPGFFEVTVWAEERSGLHDVLGVELAGPPAELGIPNSPCLQGVNGLALTKPSTPSLPGSLFRIATKTRWVDLPDRLELGAVWRFPAQGLLVVIVRFIEREAFVLAPFVRM